MALFFRSLNVILVKDILFLEVGDGSHLWNLLINIHDFLSYGARFFEDLQVHRVLKGALICSRQFW